MMLHCGCIVAFLATLTVSAARKVSPIGKDTPTDVDSDLFKTFYLEQRVDHFGFANTDTYKQRYLLADQFWSPGHGPIFYYTGNEGDITLFCNNTGFMLDIAPEFGAMLVFGEHRYYGDSLPYGSQSFETPEKLNYMTVEQALADHAILIQHIKGTIPGAESSPVVAFGGSYGGMLAAWMRMKYPNVIIGSLAASAPIFMFSDLTPCDAYMKTVTDTFAASTNQCADNIRQSWKYINDVTATAEGKALVTSTFKLCNKLVTKADVDALKSWLTDAWGSLAMVDYPYPANFLAPLPAWPVKEACQPLSTPLAGSALLTGLRSAVNVYYNYTGAVPCFNISQSSTPSLGDIGWSYQACTEIIQGSCTNGVTDMFEPSEWNITLYSEGCRKSWGITPRPHWGPLQYWGKHLETASNIIFSNGELDPWSTSGVMSATHLPKSLVVLVIKDGAHHLDLRGANPLDPISVIKVREQEKKTMKMWIQDYWSSLKH